MSVKSKTLKALNIAWKCIKFPFQVVHFIWKHKVISALAAIGLWWGAGKLKEATYGDSDNYAPRVTQRAPKKQVKKAQKQSQLAALEAAASQAVEKKSLVSSALGDAANKDGPRLLPAKDRIATFVEQGSKSSTHPDKKGFNTIIICDQTNVQNYAILHIGFHHNTNKRMDNFLLYRSCIKSENGEIPQLKTPFNISFDVPGIRMGVNIGTNDCKLTKFQDSAGTVPVSKDNGQTLLLVTQDGTLQHVTDTNVINTVFQNFPVDQKAPVLKQDFIAYRDPGVYEQPKTQTRTISGTNLKKKVKAR